MKRVLSILLLSIFLVSCAGNKWSCKKRYCQEKPKEIVITENC